MGHPQGQSLTLGGVPPSDFPLSITIFANSAAARKQQFKLTEIDQERRLDQILSDEVRNIHQIMQRSSPQPRIGTLELKIRRRDP